MWISSLLTAMYMTYLSVLLFRNPLSTTPFWFATISIHLGSLKHICPHKIIMPRRKQKKFCLHLLLDHRSRFHIQNWARNTFRNKSNLLANWNHYRFVLGILCWWIKKSIDVSLWLLEMSKQWIEFPMCMNLFLYLLESTFSMVYIYSVSCMVKLLPLLKNGRIETKQNFKHLWRMIKMV